MTRYRLSLAVLCGVGLATLTPLLINGSSWTAELAMFMLFPGGLVAGILLHSDLPFLVIAGNACIYSGLTYIILGFTRRLTTRHLRLASIYMVGPVAILVAADCAPELNPLLPTGMADLQRQETELRDAFPDKMDIEQARAVLKAKKIEFFESTSPAGVLAQYGSPDLQVSSGNRLIHSSFQTKAAQWPCGYRMEIDLLFDAAGILGHRYIQRFRDCP
jgi:hypothetical protein